MNRPNPLDVWEVNASDYPTKGPFSGQAEFLIRYALLAPNSHNTQPWKFRIHDKYIDILPDLNRALNYSDREHRQLTISLGTALANLLIAAAHFGFSPVYEFNPESELDPVSVRINLGKNGPSPKIPKQLFPEITRRHSNRGLYLTQPVSQEVLKELTLLSRNQHVHAHFITDPAAIAAISELIVESIEFAFNDNVFKAELSRWVRSNNTSRPDGMTLNGFGIPDFLSLFAPWLILMSPAKMQSALDRKLVMSASCLLVITGNTDDKSAWLDTGLMYETIALTVTRHQLASSTMAGIIEYPVTNKKLKKLLNTNETPQYLARIGFPPKALPHTPRRTVAEIVVQ